MINIDLKKSPDRLSAVLGEHLVKLAVMFSERFAFTIPGYFALVPSILVSHLRCYWADDSFSLFH